MRLLSTIKLFSTAFSSTKSLLWTGTLEQSIQYKKIRAYCISLAMRASMRVSIFTRILGLGRGGLGLR